MPLATISRGPPLDYFVLHDAKPAGPSIGLYAGRDIPSSVIDDQGRRLTYAGIAPRRLNGDFDTEALGEGEFILQPGMVYRLVARKARWGLGG